MARKRDVQCSGGCGRLIWRGRGSLPPGQSTCLPCRRAHRETATERRPCANASCNRIFDSRPTTKGLRTYHSTCSQACRMAVVRSGARKLRESPCPCCGRPVLGRSRTRLCDGCRVARRRFRDRVHNTRRRGASHPDSLSVQDIARRDGWRCHLCSRRVDQALVSPHPMSATVDHLIPIVAGGDDAPENTRLAHRRCNSSRGAGGTVQLLLVG